MAEKKVPAPATPEVEVDKSKEPAFENGPTNAMVSRWKKLHKNVYMTKFDEASIFLWRPLTRAEWRRISANQSTDQLYKEEQICETTVIWPKWDSITQRTQGLAGVPSAIADQVISKSGFETVTIEPVRL